MNLRRYWVAAAVLLFLAAGAVVVLTSQGNTVQAARETVEAFCRNEFEGNNPFVRESLVRFSPEVEAEFQKSDSPWIMMYVETPRQRVVVSAYEVKDVRVEGNRATAVVAYRRLARSVNTYDDYITDRKDNDLVTLNLAFDEGWRPSGKTVPFATAVWNAVFIRDRWRVLDPPASRVSKQVLLENYEEEVKRYSSMWKQKLNDPSYDAEQKAHVRASRDKATGNLRFLKSLP